MNIPVFMASDENYAPFLCTAMYSILENTNSFIQFYILDGGICDNTKELLKKSLQSYKNYSIKYFDMSNFGLERFPNRLHYSLNTFSRYFIPQLTPELEKVLYMDVDIIVKGDIAELYNTDLSGKALAAVPENFYKKNGEYVKKYIDFNYENTINYFNAGVLLLDLKQFIKNNYQNKLIDMTIKYYDKLSCPDQDIFNLVFEHNHKLIGYKFNYMPDFYDAYAKLLNAQELQKLDNNAIIYHYTCGKPWQDKNVRKSELFWATAKKTSFYKQINKIYKFSNKNKHLYSHFYERIFSILNRNDRKVITILGIKIKLKRR